MLIERMLFDPLATAALEDVLKGRDDLVFNVSSRLGFDIAPAAEFEPAALALRDGVVGVIVGKHKNGGLSAAIETLERNANIVFLSH